MNINSSYAVVFLSLLVSPWLSAVHAAMAESSLPRKTVPITLADAVALGVRNSNTLKSVGLTRLMDKFDLVVAEDGFRPHLVLNNQYRRNMGDQLPGQENHAGLSASLLTPLGTQLEADGNDDYSGLTSSGSTRSRGNTITVVQPLLKGAGIEFNTAPVRLARLDERIGHLNQQKQIADTITQIIQTYYGLLEAQQGVMLAQESLQRAGAQRDVMQALIDSGRQAALDRLQSDADMSSQQLSLEQQENALSERRLALCGLLGVDTRTQLSASERLDIRPITLKAPQAIAVAMKNQPDYLIQQLTADKQQIYLMQAKNQRLWGVDLVAGAGRVNTRAADVQSDSRWQRYVGLNVSIPLNDLQARQQEQRAWVAGKIQLLQMADVRQQLEETITQQVNALNSNWQQFLIADRLTRLSEKTVQAEQAKLLAGRSSNFQVLSYQASLRAAQSARVSAQIAYLNSLAELDRALGSTLNHWGIQQNDR
ncbi:TolC family protein [Dickeya dianthicola]|uniref:TolC family protein n=1 Tax=Dickeya dianthicola TaxID=204039 RepID=A0AAP2CZD9_9GAMM|nr:TolC family protein [Dickeya dianthicola]ATO32733.1 Outer membrane efflux family protein [Dickeya dianthicola RNS04.9]MBT1427769.1 TolC family protein [Dickeya dianthicola]MBT1431836.1 TolC family protein [Dickeya dianthicola]MBT1459282.1 TolC family protein [Dickeya dianthicola]MBT1488479.1 TolC family protein [Dickeya dianthicola]